MPTNRKAIPLTRSIFIAPGTGSDVTGDGSVGAPFATWHTGAWPRIAALTYTDVVVTYQNATADTSPAGSYVLPVGVRVTLSCPWSVVFADTARAGSTQTDLATGGGLVVNAQSGRRIRWTSGTNLNGVNSVYSVLRNTTTDLIPSRAGFAAVPGVGDGFVVEVQAGGWAQAAAVTLDATATGSGFDFSGFKTAPSAFVQTAMLGRVRAAGLYIEGGATFAEFLWSNGECVLGLIGGSAENALSNGVTLSSPLGSPNNLCVFGHGSSIWNARLSIFSAVDLVLAGPTLAFTTTTALVNGFDLQGAYASRALSWQADSTGGAQNGVQQGASTAAPLSAVTSRVRFFSVVFDTALAADAITGTASVLDIAACSGANATAGKFGCKLDTQSTLINNGTNTVVGGGGAISLGAHAAQAVWPAAGTLVTDLADANSQACVQK